jgi:hypothetical protein
MVPVQSGIKFLFSENQNCSLTWPYTTNITLSKHSEDKIQELRFSQIALCFELFAFQYPRSDWTWIRLMEG